MPGKAKKVASTSRVGNARKPAKKKATSARAVKAKPAPLAKAKSAPLEKAKAVPGKKAQAAPGKKAQAAPGKKAQAAPKARAKMKSSAAPKRGGEMAASRRIDERIMSLGDWRGETLAMLRRLIHEADPEVVEECKWVKPSNPMGVPVWSHGGIVCTGESYKQAVKLTFMRGASLADPAGLFNSSLDGGTRRAIDIKEGEVLDAEAFKALIRAAVAENLGPSAE